MRLVAVLINMCVWGRGEGVIRKGRGYRVKGKGMGGKGKERFG